MQLVLCYCFKCKHFIGTI